MDKRISSRAIIIDNGNLLTMFRRKTKDGEVKEYYVLPGGGLEENETLEENVIREVNEEMGIDINILGYLGILENDGSIQHYFHCTITNGIPKLGGEELDRMTPENYYEVRFVNLNDLEDTDVIGKEKVKLALKKGYIKKD